MIPVHWTVNFFFLKKIFFKFYFRDCKFYVDNLGNNGNKTELERAFGYYGAL